MVRFTGHKLWQIWPSSLKGIPNPDSGVAMGHLIGGGGQKTEGSEKKLGGPEVRKFWGKNGK